MATKQEIEARLEKADKKADEGLRWKRDYDELAKQTDIRLGDLLKDNEQLKTDLAKALDHPFLRAFNDLVEERIAKYKGSFVVSTPADGTTVQQDLTLGHMTTTIKVKEEHRDLPQESTLTTRGKLIALIAVGKLDAKKEQSVIMDMLPPDLHRGAVFGELTKLVEEQVLMKVKDPKHTYYQRHPDATAKVE